MLERHLPLLRQFTFFGFIGVTSLIIDIGVSATLFYIAHFPAYIASGVGFLSAFAFNFPMNRRRVFKHSDKDRFSIQNQIAMYSLLCVFNLIVTSLLVEVMVTSLHIEIQYSKLITAGMIAVWNFILFKFVVFSKRS